MQISLFAFTSGVCIPGSKNLTALYQFRAGEQGAAWR